jgi:hypothetical protein
MPNPQDGKVANGVFTSPYFDLSYPLPDGWIEAMAGPDPSHSGYYVLGTFVPAGELTGRILVAAQDAFFAREAHGDVATAAHDFRQAMSEIDGMTIEREPSEVRVAGRLLQRVDFSGVGLHRATFVAEIRCHLVSFNLTAQDAEQLTGLAQSLDHLSPVRRRDTPACVKDYASEENALRKVEPAIPGSVTTPIPVRIIVGTDGAVKHVHVIRASAEQRKSIEEALRQWRFRPYTIEGRPVEVETGLAFRR